MIENCVLIVLLNKKWEFYYWTYWLNYYISCLFSSWECWYRAWTANNAVISWSCRTHFIKIYWESSDSKQQETILWWVLRSLAYLCCCIWRTVFGCNPVLIFVYHPTNMENLLLICRSQVEPGSIPQSVECVRITGAGFLPAVPVTKPLVLCHWTYLGIVILCFLHVITVV